MRRVDIARAGEMRAALQKRAPRKMIRFDLNVYINDKKVQA